MSAKLLRRRDMMQICRQYPARRGQAGKCDGHRIPRRVCVSKLEDKRENRSDLHGG